jgi:predicted oxidoreductase (fatty acid repression mutant protein)|tara:strand:+ start:2141 stop:2452 length:312 start_codon:yes stop_codon:yes gene_type:complete
MIYSAADCSDESIKRRIGNVKFETLVQTRRRVHVYQNESLAQEVIEELIQVAKETPPSINTQPWNLYVVFREPLNRDREGNTENMVAELKSQREFHTKKEVRE